MKRFLSLVMMLIVMVSYSALSQVPKTLNIQGVLTDGAGTPLADGNYTIGFAIYDAAAAGTKLWEEIHSTVAVADGLYNVTLGTVDESPADGNPDSPLDVLAFDSPYWLQITVGVLTLSPRIELSSVNYILNENLIDLTDGTLSGSKVGSGIDAGNLTTGTVPLGRLSGITTSELSGTAGITSDQLASVATSKLTGTVSIANGGTGASTATAARTNLGLGSVATLNSITSANITDGTITSADIENGTITAADLATNSVQAAEIAAGAVGTSEIANGSVEAEDISATLKIGFFADGPTTTSIPSGSQTKVIFGTTDFNDGSAYNTTTGEFTAPEAGVYHFSAHLNYLTISTPASRVNIYAMVNGIERAVNFMRSNEPSGPVTRTLSFVFKLNKSDKVTIEAFHNTGSNATLYSSSFFSGHRAY